MSTRTLSTLAYDDLLRCSAWRAVGDFENDEDASLEPLELKVGERVPSDVEDVWCLCDVFFADGSKHMGCALCRGDCDDGPILRSVWNGSEDIRQYVSPTPQFILVKEGPNHFCEKFRRSINSVFPITFAAVVKFETPPHERKIIIGVNGVLVTL